MDTQFVRDPARGTVADQAFDVGTFVPFLPWGTNYGLHEGIWLPDVPKGSVVIVRQVRFVDLHGGRDVVLSKGKFAGLIYTTGEWGSFHEYDAAPRLIAWAQNARAALRLLDTVGEPWLAKHPRTDLCERRHAMRRLVRQGD